jgi:hypothetical protein
MDRQQICSTECHTIRWQCPPCRWADTGREPDADSRVPRRKHMRPGDYGIDAPANVFCANPIAVTIHDDVPFKIRWFGAKPHAERLSCRRAANAKCRYQ